MVSDNIWRGCALGTKTHGLRALRIAVGITALVLLMAGGTHVEVKVEVAA